MAVFRDDRRREAVQTLYRVQMWSHPDPNPESCGSDEIIIQLLDERGHYITSAVLRDWEYAYHRLLRMLEDRNLRFVGSLPELMGVAPDGVRRLWIVTEPIEERPTREGFMVGEAMSDD